MRRAILPLLLASAACTPAVTDTRIEPNAVPPAAAAPDGYDLKEQYAKHGPVLDQPVAALLADMKQRGLLDSTMVQWSSEFGRTPLGENRGGNKNATGRDHHPFCFSMVMAGGGLKGGQVYGKTDEIGWSIEENPVHPNDLQATLLHCFGLNHKKLTYRFQGRDFRLTDVHGRVLSEILA